MWVQLHSLALIEMWASTREQVNHEAFGESDKGGDSDRIEHEMACVRGTKHL